VNALFFDHPRAKKQTRTLDVDADVVFVAIQAGQADGVFAAAAAKFEHQIVVVLKEIAVPTTFELMVALDQIEGRRLEQSFELFVGLESY
jgi:hypothetical protein